jgi:hypothetical protein
MNKKERLFLVSPKDLVKNIKFVKDSKLRSKMLKFIDQFNLDSYKSVDWSNWVGSDIPDKGKTNTAPGIYSTKGMPSYNEYITETRFDDIIDEFIGGLLSMTVSEKSDFLKSLEKLSRPINEDKSEPDNIYNIINTIYYNYSDNDLFNSVKVSKLESTGTIVLSSYNLTSIEKIKLKLKKEGIENIRYRIIKNPYNQKKIHTIMYDRIGEK